MRREIWIVVAITDRCDEPVVTGEVKEGLVNSNLILGQADYVTKLGESPLVRLDILTQSSELLVRNGMLASFGRTES